MKVRILLGLPLLILSCKTDLKSVSETYNGGSGCESIVIPPTNNEEWLDACYCTETDKLFTQCIDDWTAWVRGDSI